MSTDPRTIAVFTGSLRPDGVSAATAHSAKAACMSVGNADANASGCPLSGCASASRYACKAWRAMRGSVCAP